MVPVLTYLKLRDWHVFVNVAGAAALLIMATIWLPSPSASAAVYNLANSDPGSNQSVWMSLNDYAGQRPQVDWPLRSEGCANSGVTPYKSMPWQAATPNASYNGNNFNQSGNCATRYEDGGTSNGAWISPGAFGGWALPSGGLGGSSTTAPGSTKLLNCALFSGGAPEIWGVGFTDTSEQSTGLYRGNGYGSYSPAIGPGGGRVGLYSSGTTLFRKDFNLTASELGVLQSGTSSLTLQILADDFYIVYINGVRVTSSTDALDSSSRDLTAIKGLFNAGNNVIAIQAADKSLWYEGGGPARGVGMCYSLVLNGDAAGPPPPPPPPIPPPIPVYPDICSGPALREAPIDKSPSPAWTDSDNGIEKITYVYDHTEVNSTGADQYGQQVEAIYYEARNEPARINYTEFANQYPYDYHTGSVGYTVYFRQTIENASGSSTNLVADGRTTSAAQVPPCYNRKFDLEPTANISVIDDTENPTSATFTARVAGGYLAANEYGTGLWTSSHVDNYPLNGVYFIEDANENQISGDAPFTFGNKSSSAGGSVSRYYTGFAENSTTSQAVFRLPFKPGDSGPGLKFGDRVCFRAILPIATGSMSLEGGIQTSTASKQSLKTCSEKVGDKPYFRVYGGDIAAGGSFQSNNVCTPPTSGSIIGQYRDGSGIGKGGAATGLAAIGLGQVIGVISASQRSAPPTRLNGLTFGNDNSTVPTNTAVNQFGGNYGKSYCAPDYYKVEQFNDGDPRKNMTPSNGIINIGAGPFADGGQTVYSSPGTSKVINSPELIAKRHTIFVNGNVTIKKDIKYETANWINEKSIPYVTIIAKGNIYIDSDVTELNGLFIAQPGNGQPGRIYTCSAWQDFGRGPESVSRCRAQLKINGAFIAQQVVLQRTTGTLSSANGPQEPKTSPNTAEVFNFTPESYIGQPVFKPKTTKYDSIKDLPPVF